MYSGRQGSNQIKLNKRMCKKGDSTYWVFISFSFVKISRYIDKNGCGKIR